MFKIGLSGQMFDDADIWDHLNSAAKYGYETVEIRSTHLNPGISDEEIEKVNAFLKEHNITVNALSCFTGNYGLLSEKDAEKAFETFKEYVSLSVKLNAPMIRVWAAWQESQEADDKVWEQAAYWMKKSGEYAKKYAKKIVMEMHHGTLCDRAESSLKLLKMIDCDNVGLTLDPVNLYQVPENYTQKTINMLGKHIFNVHIKDIIELKKGESPYAFEYGYYAKHIGRFTPVRYTPKNTERYFEHRCIGKGGVDWHGVIEALEKTGYNGALIVESVSEDNKNMPSLNELAKVCIFDVKNILKKD